MARDVFYSTKHLSLRKLRELFTESRELSHEVFIDEKDATYKRIPSKKSFEEVMKLLDKQCHVVFAERNIVFGDAKPYLEVVFCTMAMEVPGDYFLWLHLSLEHLEYLTQKYNLKVL